MDSSSTINSRAPSLQIENPYKRIKFVNETLNDTHKDVRRMLRRDLEDLVKVSSFLLLIFENISGSQVVICHYFSSGALLSFIDKKKGNFFWDSNLEKVFNSYIK